MHKDFLHKSYCCDLITGEAMKWVYYKSSFVTCMHILKLTNYITSYVSS